MSVWVVVGGQFGSEGKGRISANLALKESIDICVRCGGPNSGHSFLDRAGENKILRQIPTGLVNPASRLLIPAGALVNLKVLKSEIDAFGMEQDRVGVDRNAMIIQEADIERESTLHLNERISSTGSGVGAALSRRILRGSDVKLARDVASDHPWLRGLLTDVRTEVNEAADRGKKILIEGTQGFGLSIYHSEHYPRTTSRDTTAAAFISEVGLSPRLVTNIVLVLRTFPIRVAGLRAGPLKHEISWEQLRTESGYPHEISEVTSVTKKVRRIARFDWELALAAAIANRPTEIALTGLDYIDFRNRGITNWGELTDGARHFILRVESKLGVPVRFIGTSPEFHHLIDRDHSAEERFFHKNGENGSKKPNNNTERLAVTGI